MIKKLSTKSLIVLVLVAVALFFLMQTSSAKPVSYYKTAPTAPSDVPTTGGGGGGGVHGIDMQDLGDQYASADMSGSINLDLGCAMKAGTGLSSSLLPHEVASQEDYAQFAPNDILKGQNFLDPRNQVGWPETIGGTLRNGNQQLRADPPNPKSAYTWNNSTIVPDLMQRNLCT
jgi:hypothetical protein